MSSSRFNRRMFLRGLIRHPVPPLAPEKAFAADPALNPVAKRFFAIRTAHGGVWHGNLFPEDDGNSTCGSRHPLGCVAHVGRFTGVPCAMPLLRN